MKSISKLLMPLFSAVALLAGASDAYADVFFKYVGETFFFPMPKAPLGVVDPKSVVFASPIPNINIDNSEHTGKATIVEYYQGDQWVECTFNYSYVQGTSMVTLRHRESHLVVCKSNDISIDAPRSTMRVGDGMQMSYRFEHMTYDAEPQIKWSCASKCASVDFRGYVTALAEGTAIITASSNMGSNMAEFRIRIEGTGSSEPSGFSIIGTKMELKVGQSKKLDWVFTPSGTSSPLTWSTSDKSVATVDNGSVKGVGKGTARISAKTKNGLSDFIMVTVSSESSGDSDDDMSVSLPSKKEICKGYGMQLKAETSTDDAAPKMEWSTSDPSVARVSSSGFVTAVETGTADITCTLSNGKSATCQVKVVTAPSDFDVSNIRTRIKILKNHANILINLLK